MEFRHLLYEKMDAIVKVTLNRPDRLNAMNRRLRDEIVVAMEDCQADDDVRVVVITGNGRAFCSGDDQKESSGEDLSDVEEYPLRLRTLYARTNTPEGVVRTIRALRAIEKPVIAMVNGLAYGGGNELALASDFCIASENATFCAPYVNLGMSAGMFQLPYFLGFRKVTEMLFLGEPVTAKEAQAIGLINKAVPAEQLEDVTMELAHKLAKAPTKAIGADKIALNRIIGASQEEVWTLAADAGVRSGHSDDIREGRRAFNEKRKPVFRGQ